MFSPKLRLILIVLFIVCGFVTIFMELGYYAPLVLFSTGFLLLLGHFRHGSMAHVLSALRKGKIPQAQELIQTIKRPEWLSKKFQGYYFFSLSLIATYSQDIEAAEINAKKALDLGNLPINEQGLLYYNLARVAFEKKQWDKSKKQLLALKQIDIKDLHLKQRIEELQKALQNK